MPSVGPQGTRESRTRQIRAVRWVLDYVARPGVEAGDAFLLSLRLRLKAGEKRAKAEGYTDAEKYSFLLREESRRLAEETSRYLALVARYEDMPEASVEEVDLQDEAP